MDIGCIKIDGVALDALDDAVLASGVFANKEAKVLLLPLSSLPSSRPLLESLLEVAGEAVVERYADLLAGLHSSPLGLRRPVRALDPLRAPRELGREDPELVARGRLDAREDERRRRRHAGHLLEV